MEKKGKRQEDCQEETSSRRRGSVDMSHPQRWTGRDEHEDATDTTRTSTDVTSAPVVLSVREAERRRAVQARAEEEKTPQGTNSTNRNNLCARTDCTCGHCGHCTDGIDLMQKEQREQLGPPQLIAAQKIEQDQRQLEEMYEKEKLDAPDANTLISDSLKQRARE